MANIGEYFRPNNNNAIANRKLVFQGDKYRITVLSDILVRLEYDEAGIFEDRLTELVVNRNFEYFKFDVAEDAKTLIITTKYFRLQYIKNKPFWGSKFAPDANLKIILLETDKEWYFGHDEARNYQGIIYDLDTQDKYQTYAEKILVSNLQKQKKKIEKVNVTSKRKGLYSTDGFASLYDSNSLKIDENGYYVKDDRKKVDIYLFMYKRDFGLCLKDYFKLTGEPALIPRYALGIWWNKNGKYTFNQIKDLVFDFNKYRIPLSTFILDDNWHIKDRDNVLSYKSGFTFNRDLFPKPMELSSYLHDRGIRFGVNIDPAEGILPHESKFDDFAKELGLTEKQTIPFNALDKVFIAAYLEKLIAPLYNQGIDFFWIDYNTNNLDNLDALNYYHFNDYQRFVGQRGMILSRLSRYAAHRYPIHYSGETIVGWDTLKKLPEYNLTASNLGLTWISHAISGFKSGIEDAELYIRYVQLGTYSPIMRFAAEAGHYYKREPWRWDVKTLEIVREYCQRRQRLIPYLYGEAYKYYKGGVPLIQPLYYKVPELYDEIDYKNEYYFGTELLVAPITKPKDLIMQRAVEKIYLPEGKWYDFKTGKKYPGDKRQVIFYKDEDYPIFAKSGSIICMADLEDNLNVSNPPQTMEVHVFPGKSNIYNLYEDDGYSSLFEKGYYIVTRFDYNYMANNYTLIIRPFEGKSGIIPDKRTYRIRFRNTRQADEVRVMLADTELVHDDYVEDTDFIVEIKDVDTTKQLTVICKGKDIEIDAVRLINEDIDSIISDLQIETRLKEMIGSVMFSKDDIGRKRINIKHLKREGLDPLFIRMFLKLLEYTQEI